MKPGRFFSFPLQVKILNIPPETMMDVGAWIIYFLGHNARCLPSGYLT